MESAAREGEDYNSLLKKKKEGKMEVKNERECGTLPLTRARR